MRDTILLSIHQKNFRNGAFVNLIAKDTPVVDALNILHMSSHLSSSEKDNTKSVRDQFIALRSRVPDNELPGLLGMLPLHDPMEKMMKIFDDDASARGLYVPQDMIQVMNKDGSVKQSTIMNVDGTGTVTEGGVHGVPPGASEEFVRLQKENTNLFTDAATAVENAAPKCR
jgi:hypothetical protein